MKKTLRLVLLFALLAGAGASVYLWSPWKTKEGPPLKVEAVKVDKGTIAARVTATGTVAPRNAVQVGAQVSGRLGAVLADWNDEVKAGQVIARLEPESYEAQVAQAKANLEVARANLAQAEAESREAGRQKKRLDDLGKKGLVSASEVDVAETRLRSARAAINARKALVAQTEAALAQAELALGYTVIHSPVDGVILQRSVDVGQTVAASLQAPTLFTIAEDLRRMQIDTNVVEGDVGRISGGMPATFTVDAFPGRRFEGRVRQVRNAPTTVSGVVTYNAVIDVDNDDLALKPGMTANVTFVTKEISDVVRLPNAALRFRPTPEASRRLKGEAKADKASGGLLTGLGGPRANNQSATESDGKRVVWKVEGPGRARPVKVTTGLTDGTYTELGEADGGDLKVGDELVTDVPNAGGP